MDPDQEQSDLGPHCLPVCKNRFEKFARIFSRQHKQTTFSDAGFLGVLRVKRTCLFYCFLYKLNVKKIAFGNKYIQENGSLGFIETLHKQ